MSQTEERVQTAAEVELDVLVDELKKAGKTVAYSLVRYDHGPDGKSFWSTVRLSYPTDASPDRAVDRLLSCDDGDAHVSDERVEGVVNNLIAAGWNVMIGVETDVDGDLIYVRDVAFADSDAENYPDIFHRRLDMIRELIVAWHNARHTQKLVWGPNPAGPLPAWPNDRSPTPDEVEVAR